MFGISNGDFGGDLRLRSATRENNVDGNYTCYVENQAGSDSATYQVHVQGTPKSFYIYNTQNKMLFSILFDT